MRNSKCSNVANSKWTRLSNQNFCASRKIGKKLEISIFTSLIAHLHILTVFSRELKKRVKWTVPLNIMALNAEQLQNATDSITDPTSKALFGLLSGQLAKQNEQIVEVLNVTTDLRTRITLPCKRLFNIRKRSKFIWL